MHFHEMRQRHKPPRILDINSTKA